jgi:hypothetical protein
VVCLRTFNPPRVAAFQALEVPVRASKFIADLIPKPLCARVFGYGVAIQLEA